MRPGRLIVRLAVVMIAMIIAYALPSVALAHEGHDHHYTAVAEVQVAPTAASAHTHLSPTANTAVASAKSAIGAEALTSPPATACWSTAASTSGGSVVTDGIGKGCCPGACQGSCCGPMACCASGVLTGPAPLPTRAFGHVRLVPNDDVVVSGIGPEALPKPPRPLA